MAFAVTIAARLLLFPPKGGGAHDAAGFASRYGPLSRSPNRAFDAGLRPGPLPDRAASLLPGLLTATRTGPSPAGDDELMLDQVISINHPQLWAHIASRRREWRVAWVRALPLVVRSERQFGAVERSHPLKEERGV